MSKDTLGTYEIPLYFHPGQRGSNSVLSGNVQTGNLLCQATVPKLTGRKRKRGSSAPFREPEDHDEAYQSKPLGADGMSMSERMLHGLRANAEPDRLKVVGIIERTHRFRSKSLNASAVLLLTKQQCLISSILLRIMLL